jgi:hypothetical protein
MCHESAMTKRRKLTVAAFDLGTAPLPTPSGLVNVDALPETTYLFGCEFGDRLVAHFRAPILTCRAGGC